MKRTCVSPDTKNHYEKTTLDVAKKFLETYYSAAQYPEERLKLTYLHYFMNLEIYHIYSIKRPTSNKRPP